VRRAAAPRDPARDRRTDSWILRRHLAAFRDRLAGRARAPPNGNGAAIAGAILDRCEGAPGEA